jgi:hypothetical protein
MTEQSFVEQLEKAYGRSGYLTKRELGVGYGVADLVLLRLNPTQCTVRLAHKQLRPLLKEDYFKVFESLPDQDGGKLPVTLERLTRKTKLSKRTLKYDTLKFLEQGGYVRQAADGLYFKVNGWIPIAEETIAIEAKLHDWKRGFLQANRYKSFANRVYLAIPSERGHLVNQRLLRRHNVGLIFFDARTSTLQEIIRPRFAKPRNRIKHNFASEFFMTPRVLREYAIA